VTTPRGESKVRCLLMDTRVEAFELARCWPTSEDHSLLRIVVHPKYRPWLAKRAGNRVENVRLGPTHSLLLQPYRRCVLVPVGPGERLVHDSRFVTLRTDMSRVADSRARAARSRNSRSGEPVARAGIPTARVKKQNPTEVNQSGFEGFNLPKSYSPDWR
jgi:hypothetical protein